MAITLESVPVTNTLTLDARFYLRDQHLVTLGYDEAKTLTLTFDRITVGNAYPTHYRPEDPQNRSIPTGNLAFLEPVADDGRELALRYGAVGKREQSVLFVS